LGAQVQYQQIDVTNRDAVIDMIESVLHEHGKLTNWIGKIGSCARHSIH